MIPVKVTTRGLALLALAVLVLASPVWGPYLLRRVPWFGVRRVEISGTRLLAPHTVLEASGIRRGHNVWDDPRRWERALREHPAVANARVTRRLPRTLRIRVEEKRPVAYVEAGALHPATAEGELLPLDPSRSPVDLPIVRAAWPDSAGAATSPEAHRLLAEVGRLSQLDPGLMADVSEVRPAAGEPRLLVLTHRLAEITLPADAGPERLAQLRAVLGDLERRLGAAQGLPPAPARVDLRFQDQIVVRLPSSV